MEPAETEKRPALSRADLAAAGRSVLPDLVRPGLAVLLCGLNPGLTSAAWGQHFSNPGNRLWPALHRSGFTPRQLTAWEEDELLALGVGITSLVARPTAQASELSAAEFRAGGGLLRERVRELRPQWLAFLGVSGFRVAFDAPGAAVGPQPERLGTTRVWVLPSPSGRNAHYPPTALAAEFTRLREAAGLPDRREG